MHPLTLLLHGLLSVLPGLQADPPNFVCNLVTLLKPYVGGAIVLGLLGIGAGFALRFALPQMSMVLTSGLIGLGAAMFIVGIAVTPASLVAIAGVFGLANGITFCQ